MRRRRILIGLGIFCILVLGVFAIAAYNASTIAARIKPELEALASEKVGGKVELGSLEVGFFPKVHLTAEGVSVQANGKHPWEGTFGSISLSLKIFPLITKSVSIDHLTLVRPNITVHERSKEVTQGNPKPPNEAAPRGERPAESESSVKLALQRLEIADGTLRYVLSGDKLPLTIAQLNLTTG